MLEKAIEWTVVFIAFCGLMAIVTGEVTIPYSKLGNPIYIGGE